MEQINKIPFTGSDSDDAQPEKFHKPDLARRNARRIGKQAQARRKEKCATYRNEQAYQRRLDRLSDPIYNFSRTEDRDDLEAKFAKWDQILQNGGTIFDDSELGGPLLIETEQLDDIQQVKNSMFVMRQCEDEEVLEFNSSSVLPSDEMDAESDTDSSSDPDAMDQDDEDLTPEEKPHWSRSVDLGSITTSRPSVDLGNLPKPRRVFDLSTGTAATPTPAPKAQSSEDKPAPTPQLNVWWRGEVFHLDRDVDLTPTIRSPDPADPPPQIQAFDFEPLSVEIYRKTPFGIHAWMSHRVARIVCSPRVMDVTQFHPLTRREAFQDWDVRMCVYRPDSLGDYVRELVPANHRVRLK